MTVAEWAVVGPHRAWCLSCSEWCYPDEDGMCPCCQETLGREALWIDPKVGPPERVILTDLIAELRDGCARQEEAVGPLITTHRVREHLDRAEARLREVTE